MAVVSLKIDSTVPGMWDNGTNFWFANCNKASVQRHAATRKSLMKYTCRKHGVNKHFNWKYKCYTYNNAMSKNESIWVALQLKSSRHTEHLIIDNADQIVEYLITE